MEEVARFFLDYPGAMALLGFLVGMLGTLVGAGGGFILVPILVFVLPQQPVDHITAISMAMVFCNALSGTIAYAFMRRIDLRGGKVFAIAAMPGALLGAMATAYITRLFFDRFLGIALIVVAIFLLYRTFALSKGSADQNENSRSFTPDRRGLRIGALLSAGVGFISSLLGIGGGIIHVPALIYLLGYPIHLATATSHFVLACTSFVAVLEHIYRGSYADHLEITAALSVGAVIGAQVGARLSKRVKGPAIVGCLAIALVFAGARIILRTFV